MKNLSADLIIRLFHRKRKSSSRPVLGAVTGIALSMIPLIVVLFLSDSMIRGITDRYIETGSYHLQLRSYKNRDQQEWKDSAAAAESLPGIRVAMLEHSGMGLAYAGDKQGAVSLRAVESSRIKNDSNFISYITMLSGNFSLDDAKSAVVGRETAETLGLKVGDSFRIMTGKTLSTGKYIPRISTFTVRGIFTTGYQDLDKLWVFIPLERGWKIMKDNESTTKILIKTDDPYGNLSPRIEDLRSILDDGRWGIYTWLSLNRSQQSNYRTTRSLLILIMVMIVLVAVMNISSSMVMLVMDNEQEIGIMKSLGMENSMLSRQYIITSGLAGGTGSLIGIAAGTLISLRFNDLVKSGEWLINLVLSLFYSLTGRLNPGPVSLLNKEYYLENFDVAPEPGMLLIIFIATVLLSMFAALIPIRHIGTISPLDILRKH